MINRKYHLAALGTPADCAKGLDEQIALRNPRALHVADEHLEEATRVARSVVGAALKALPDDAKLVVRINAHDQPGAATAYVITLDVMEPARP